MHASLHAWWYKQPTPGINSPNVYAGGLGGLAGGRRGPCQVTTFQGARDYCEKGNDGNTPWTFGVSDDGSITTGSSVRARICMDQEEVRTGNESVY